MTQQEKTRGRRGFSPPSAEKGFLIKITIDKSMAMHMVTCNGKEPPLKHKTIQLANLNTNGEVTEVEYFPMRQLKCCLY